MSTIEDRMQVLTMIKDLANYFEHAKDKLCEPYNFTSIQATILLDLAENGKSRVTSICSRLGKSTNTISPLLQRLERLGYVKKYQSEGDKRVMYVNLSTKGKELMKKYLNDAGSYSWPIFDKLDDEEFQMIYKSLVKLTDILKD